MTRDTYSSLKKKIEKEILKLQKQAQALQTKQRGPVIASIIRSMREYDITPEELTLAFNKKATGPSQRNATAAKPSATKPTAVKRPVAPKYRHPETGATWTGRGKAPRWVTAAEAEGKNRNDFLIA
ncbi:H-NS histone family protein [Alcaligenaceae bacterium]|nr:H-NS histone family protein [Alcaligenaceae bacterium]